MDFISAVLIAPEGAESPSSGRIGVIGTVVYLFSPEAV